MSGSSPILTSLSPDKSMHLNNPGTNVHGRVLLEIADVTRTDQVNFRGVTCTEYHGIRLPHLGDEVYMLLYTVCSPNWREIEGGGVIQQERNWKSDGEGSSIHLDSM